MRNDRPKVIVATVIFLLATIAAGAEAVITSGHQPVAAFSWTLVAFFCVVCGILLIVILANDPYPRRDAINTQLPLRAMAHVLQFTVGERETHDVLYRWDQIWGWITVTVDGSLVLKRLTIISFSLVTAVEFRVGQEETHLVRVEKRRPLVVAAVRPQPLTAYIDGVPLPTGIEPPSA